MAEASRSSAARGVLIADDADDTETESMETDAR